MTDTERLDYLQSLTKKCGYGWILRDSVTGRGMRLHETSACQSWKDVRIAIDQHKKESDEVSNEVG